MVKKKRSGAYYGPRNQDPKRMTKKDKEKQLLLRKVKMMPEDVLDKRQMEKFEKATTYQKIWLLEFLNCGNADDAADVAYPNAKPSTRRQLAYRNRLKFDISVSDLYRAAGITEATCITATKQLLGAEKITRTFRSGDATIKETTEDTHAIDRGLTHAEKMLEIEPAQKIKHGVDEDTLAGLFLAANRRKDDKCKAGGDSRP